MWWGRKFTFPKVRARRHTAAAMCMDARIPGGPVRVALLRHDPGGGSAPRLTGVAGLEPVAALDAAGDFATALVRARPDLVLVCGTHVTARTLDAVARARHTVPAASLVLLAAGWGPEAQGRAFEAGVDAVLTRDPGAGALGTLLRELARGTIAWRAPQAVRPAGAALLTAREEEVLLLVASGASNAAIGARLCITEQTVKYHLGNVFRKLGVSNRTQASRYAFRFLEPEAPAADAVVLAA
jgi:DNA-binding NarL/FixJ family response regulator